jgi:hypothetical protein
VSADFVYQPPINSRAAVATKQGGNEMTRERLGILVSIINATLMAIALSAPSWADSTKPQVFITTPFDGQHLDSFTTGVMEFPLDGYVIEDDSLTSLTIQVEGPNGQTLSDVLSYSQDQSKYYFGDPRMQGMIFHGHNRITVTAEDCDGEVGSASVDVYFSPLEGKAELLVLYPEELRSALPWLKIWKDYSGMPTGLVSVEAIDVDPRFANAYDLPEKIKYAIAFAYRAHGTRYVMLMGDADKFPVRYVRHGRVNVSWGVCWAPSDLYYADLFNQYGGFSNWDANGNHVYGEWWNPYSENETAPDFATINMDDCDLRPDVAVGRVPASNRIEAIAYIAKVFDYEFHFTSDDFYQTLLFNGDTDWMNDHAALDWVEQNTLTGFSHKKCYRPSDYDSMSDSDQQYAKNEMRQCVFDTLTQGVGFTAFFGHGAPDTMGRILNKSDAPSVSKRTQTSVFFARACSTAMFHFIADKYQDVNGNLPPGSTTSNLHSWTDPRPEPMPLQPDYVDIDSMAEALLLRAFSGAVGYVGAHKGVHLASVFIAQKFFESWDAGCHRLGDMWNHAVFAFANERLYSGDAIGKDPFQSHHIHKYLLFGDPSLRVGGLSEDLRDEILDAPAIRYETIQEGLDSMLDREVEAFRNLAYPRYTREVVITLKGETSVKGMVRLYQDQKLLAEAQADDRGAFSMRIAGLEEGDHTLALTLESSKLKIEHRIVRISVYRSAPKVRNVRSCEECGPRDVVVKGETQHDETVVELFANGERIGIDNSRHGGRFEIRPKAPLSDGVHDFTLRLRDAAGNVAEYPSIIKVFITGKNEHETNAFK